MLCLVLVRLNCIRGLQIGLAASLTLVMQQAAFNARQLSWKSEHG